MPESVGFELPPSTAIFPPDSKHRVCIMFPDPDSAMNFFNVLKQIAIDVSGFQDAAEA